MQKLILLISLTTSLVVSGCSSMMKNSISFAIKGQNKSYIYKNTWPECANFKINSSLKYNDLSDNCKVSPEGYVPQQIIIEYAPWLTYEEQQKIPEFKGKEVIITGDRVTPYGITKDAFIGKDENALKYNTTILKKNIESAIDKLPPYCMKTDCTHSS